MRFLSHLSPADGDLLSAINNDWPLQFTPEFSRFHKEFKKDSVQILYDETLKAYLPVRFMKLRFFQPAQLLHPPLRNGVELPADEQEVFFNKLISVLKRSGGCDRLVQPHPYGFLAAHPKEVPFCEFGTYIVDLENQTPEEILARFHPKYQKAVAHSERNGAEVRFGRQTLDDFFAIYAGTMKRAGIHTDPRPYFDALYKYLTEQHVETGVVYDQGEPVSSLLVIYSNYSALLTHAGSTPESRLYGANKLLNFEMMKRLKTKGVRKYDFVGVRLNNNNAALEGIFRFKKGFGGDLKTGYLWKTDIRAFRARSYDLLLKIKSRGKVVKDIIDQVNT
jgi:hypothetical protein